MNTDTDTPVADIQHTFGDCCSQLFVRTGCYISAASATISFPNILIAHGFTLKGEPDETHRTCDLHLTTQLGCSGWREFGHDPVNHHWRVEIDPAHQNITVAEDTTDFFTVDCDDYPWMKDVLKAGHLIAEFLPFDNRRAPHRALRIVLPARRA